MDPELSARLEALEARLAALEALLARVAALEERAETATTGEAPADIEGRLARLEAHNGW